MSVWPGPREWCVYLTAFALFACGDGSGPDDNGDIARVIVEAVDPDLSGAVVVYDAVQLEVVLLDSTDQVLPSRPATWRSSDPTLATVSSTGLLVGVKAGRVTITGAVGLKTGTYVTDVLPLAASLEFLPARLGLVPDGVYDLAVIFRDSAGVQLGPEGRRIVWENPAPAVALLEGGINAVVTGLAPGTATLTATGSGATASVEVDVATTQFTTIFAGSRHSCGITTQDVAYCWGSNVQNALAAPIGNFSIAPLRTEGIGPAAAAVSGNGHVCALTLARDSYCWGYSSFGQLGDGSSDPTVNGVLPPRKTAGGLHFASLSLGDGYTCGLTTTGVAYCWGGSTEGMLGNGTEDDITATPTPVSGGLIFTELHTHPVGRSVCGLVAGGQAWCWGRNANGQLGDGTTDERTVPTAVAGGLAFTTITVGVRHVCGLTADGAAYCWGDNELGQLGQDGEHLTPSSVDGGLDFTAITAGTAYTCGIVTSGEAYCWGDNEQGQLGNGTTTASPLPVLVSGGLVFSQLSAGQDHTCGLTDAQVAYCWGFGEAVGVSVDGFIPIPAKVWGQP